MRLLAEQTVSISCDVTTAFAYVANMENFSQWFPGVRSLVSNNSLQPTDIGKEYREVFTAAGKDQNIVLRVKEVQRDGLFITEGEYPPLLPRMEVTFQSQGAQSCSVIWRMFSRNHSFIGGFTWLPLARRVIRGRSSLGVQQLKKILES